MLESYHHKNTDYFFQMHFLTGQEKLLVTSYVLSWRTYFCCFNFEKALAPRSLLDIPSYIFTCAEIIKHLTHLSKRDSDVFGI